jgi:hypothetical protein
MHNPFTTGGSVGAASRPLACVFPGNRTGEPPPVNAVEGPSAFLAPESGRLWLRAKAQQAHARGGFWRKRIARGCRSKAGRRIRRRAPLDRPTQCSDAAAPVSKESSSTCESGLAFLRPLNHSPEAKMAKTLIVGTVPSEFEIQSFLYQRLLDAGHRVRGEVRCNLAGRRARFDLLTLDNEGSPVYAIEVKPKRGARWRVEWMRTQQYRCYSAMPLPVFMVCGRHQADAFLAVVSRPATGHRNGVIWIEEWTPKE